MAGARSGGSASGRSRPWPSTGTVTGVRVYSTHATPRVEMAPPTGPVSTERGCHERGTAMPTRSYRRNTLWCRRLEKERAACQLPISFTSGKFSSQMSR